MAVEEGTAETSSKPPSYKTALAKEGEEGDRLLGSDGNGADKGKNGKGVTPELTRVQQRTSDLIYNFDLCDPYFNPGPNAEEALIHKLEGGDANETTPPTNEHDSIGAMAGEVRDKDKDREGDIRRLAAKVKAKARRKKDAQKDTQQPGRFSAEGM